MQPPLETIHWHNSPSLDDHLQKARLSAKARHSHGSPAVLKCHLFGPRPRVLLCRSTSAAGLALGGEFGGDVKLITSAIGATARGKKLGRAEALRRAMLAMIDKGKPHEAHPAYWAPFVVVGEGAAPR
jgi:CHAT domain